MIETHDVEANGVRLHVATAGPHDAPPLILLHGWPESRHGWDPAIPLLAGEYRLIMPDQRGFGRSDRPEGTDGYRMGMLVGDVAALIEWSGHDRIYLVGHDMGAAVAWACGAIIPDRIVRMVTMCAPHPMHFRRVAIAHPEQLQRAFYAWLLQTDEGQRLLAADDYVRLAAWAFGRSAVTEAQRDAYRAEWAEPGAFAAMAEWYKANYNPALFNPDVPLELPPVRAPTRYLHGERDFAFVPEMATGSGEFVDADYDEQIVPGTTHWMIHERPDEVARLITEWLRV